MYVFGTAILVAVAYFAARFLRSRRRNTYSNPVAEPEPLPMSRPRFKDFRYSGSTYEESMANYQSALRQWQEQNGITYGDDE
jgi:hypothetical protein